MRKICIYHLLLFSLIGVGLVMGRQHARTQESSESDRYMKIDEIERGMKGYGLTVFEGTDIEEFKVRVIDVIKNSGPDMDRILVRMDHPRLKEAKVVAGMSGSPVYLYENQEKQEKPKIIGAVAYGLGPFQKQAVVGLTPIHEMLTDLRRPREQSFRSPDKQYVRGDTDRRKREANRVPLTSLSISGVPDSVFEKFEKRFREKGLNPMQNSGGGVDKDLDLRLRPGSAVGLQLVFGDMNVTAIGTVTDRIGGKILAFGHPFQHLGKISMPMTTAFVHTIVATQNESFKIASPVKTVGSFLVDRRTGIYGAIGESSSTVPVSVTIRNKVTEYQKDYTYSMIRKPKFLPLLLQLVLSRSVASTEAPNSSLTDMTAEYSMDLEFQKLGTISFQNMTTGGTFNPFPRLSKRLNTLFNNPFSEDIALTNADLTVNVEHEKRISKLESIWIEEDTPESGEEIVVNARFRTYRGGLVIKTFTLPLPEDLPEGTYKVQVGPSRSIGQHKYKPGSLPELFSLLKHQSRPMNEVAVSLEIPKVSLTSGSDRLDNIPPSTVGGLMGESSSEVIVQSDRVVKRKELSWVVNGKQEISIEVNK